MKLEELSAVELGKRLAKRELSSREVTQYFIDRIEQQNPSVNAFVRVDPDVALADAEQVDKRLDEAARGGQPLASTLAGVPISLKDILCVKGIPTTCGSRMLENYRPPYNSTVVERLRAAGLVLLGKTNLDEFAMGGSTETSMFGATRNPWNTQLTAGGSSGGAAVSVAAGMVPLALGTDTGGSVRQPAAFCGVLGLKPTYGRVSRYGLIAYASSLDQIGPMAHHAEDLALTMEIIAGHDERDSTSLSKPADHYSQTLGSSLKGLRVGLLSSQLSAAGLDKDIQTACQRAANALKELGATIVDIELPHAAHSVAAYYLIAPSEASSNLARYDGAHYGYRATLPSNAATLEDMYVRSRSEGFGSEVQRRIMIGTYALSSGYYDAYYKKALQLRRLIYNDYHAAFQQVDVILGPVAPSTAFKLGDKINDPVQMYLEDLFTVGANLAGIPALSVPAGLNQSGVPLAIQLQGAPLSEGRLLAAAHQLQQSGFFKPQIARPS